jgi:hypothetical protein
MKILIGFIIYIVVSNLIMLYLIYLAPSIDDNGNIIEEGKDNDNRWDDNKQNTENNF